MFLFFICFAPNLNMFGMLSKPLFINFLLNSELRALEPNSKPAFARLDASPYPLFAAFLFTLIFLSPSCARLT